MTICFTGGLDLGAEMVIPRNKQKPGGKKQRPNSSMPQFLVIWAG